uniref:Serine/arginine repetitive matrix protein 2 n=1 Tax=Caenorhabditis tropicalis TaxID=1561998 RepID=A0A1I7TQ48_9PELO
MGGSQSTTSSRAAKFSGNGGNRRSVRAVRSAPATELNSRRATSCRNTNRNVKEFSKFWSDAGSVNRSKSSTRASVKQRNGNGNGSIRRNRTQSVDVRRASNCLPVPGTPSSTSPRPNPRRATSFRSNVSTTSSSTLTVNGEGRKSRKNSTTDLLTPNNSGRSEVYSVEFNQAAIAAARLKRLSLTPYPNDSPLQRHHRSNSTKKSTSSTTSSTSTLATPSKNLTPGHRPSSQHSHRNSYHNSPETAIY